LQKKNIIPRHSAPINSIEIKNWNKKVNFEILKRLLEEVFDTEINFDYKEINRIKNKIPNIYA